MADATPLADPDARWLPIGDVRRWDQNPRDNARAVPAVAASIRRFGFVAPAVVWRARGRLVAGHTRLAALASILAEDPAFVPRGAPAGVGPGLLPVRFHDFASDDDAAAYAVADNRLNELATWDRDALTRTLAALPRVDLPTIGFSLDAVRVELPADLGADRLRVALAPPTPHPTPVRTPPPPDDPSPAAPPAPSPPLPAPEPAPEALRAPPQPVSPARPLGEGEGTVEDVLAGRARWALVCGDAEDALRAFPPDAFDALVTDPPYSSGGQFRGDRAKAPTTKYTSTHEGSQGYRPDFGGDTRDQESFRVWLTDVLRSTLRPVKSAAAILVFMDWRQLPTVTGVVQGAGYIWRGLVPWDKGPATRPRHCGFRAQAEYVVWATKGPHAPWEGGPYLPGVLAFPVPKADRHHVTPKPVALLRELVKLVPPGGVVLDPFAGGGTTGVGALLEGRRAVLVEREPAYQDVIRRRMAAACRGETLSATSPTADSPDEDA